MISQFGYHTYCVYQLFEAKEAAHEAILQQLPENLLTKIALDNNTTAIEWEEEGKEFKLNGQMYDVVHTTYENGKTYLHCFGDKNEDEVLAKFQSVIKNTLDNSTEKSNHTVKMIMPEWLFEVQEMVINNQTSIIPSQKYMSYSSRLCNTDVQITYSPPDLII
jgi:hypothetical protein